MPERKQPDWKKDVRPFASAYPINSVLESQFDGHAGLAELPRIGLCLRRAICIPSTTSYDGSVAVWADNPPERGMVFLSPQADPATSAECRICFDV